MFLSNYWAHNLQNERRLELGRVIIILLSVGLERVIDDSN